LDQRLAQARRDLESAGADLLLEMVDRPSIEQRAAWLGRQATGSGEPQLSSVSGWRGWCVYNVKRVVRKLTRWYVEPRWAAERAYDAELSRFAADVAAHVTALEGRVAQLEASNGRLLREARLREMSVHTERAG
jgi:hypothetical protein